MTGHCKLTQSLVIWSLVKSVTNPWLLVRSLCSSSWLLSSMLLPGLAGGHHTALGIRLKQLLYIRSTVHKLMRTELESFVLGQIHEWAACRGGACSLVQYDKNPSSSQQKLLSSRCVCLKIQPLKISKINAKTIIFKYAKRKVLLVLSPYLANPVWSSLRN